MGGRGDVEQVRQVRRDEIIDLKVRSNILKVPVELLKDGVMCSREADV